VLWCACSRAARAAGPAPRADADDENGSAAA
jgi:hypothetical protein